MKILRIFESKREYMDLLLQSDPDKNMIETYLDSAEMFALYDEGEVKTVCVVNVMKRRNCEIKNIVTKKEDRNKGYGKKMIDYLSEFYADQCDTMFAGAGNCPMMEEFYDSLGFIEAYVIPDFYTNNYKQEIFEDGYLIKDKIFYRKNLQQIINKKRVIELAIEAGRILLKNGGEIFRVDETIKRICAHFNVDNLDTFILSHAIFISSIDETGESFTRVKHVPLASPNLGLVAEVNHLSREITAGNVTIDEAFQRLKDIDEMPEKKWYYQVLAAGLGSASFGCLLGATVLEGFCAFVIGVIVYTWVLFAVKHKVSRIVVNILGGAFIPVVAVFMEWILGKQLNISSMIVGAIMPLVSGVAFVNAIRDIADSDFLSGTVRMIDALLGFIYIAIGVGITLGMFSNMLGGIGM